MGGETSIYWKSVKRVAKLRRDARKVQLLKQLPLVREYCKANDVEVVRVAHGIQFRIFEYIITWSLPSNGVQVQFSLPGSQETVPWTGVVEPGQLKIMTALQEAVQLVHNRSS